MSERRDRLQTLYYCNYRCVCCNETKDSKLIYKEIDNIKLILCKSCAEILRLGNIKKLIHRFGVKKKGITQNKKEKEFKKYLHIERLKGNID